MSCVMGASLEQSLIRNKRLARVYHPNKAKVMTKNDYKRNKFNKYKKKKKD